MNINFFFIFIFLGLNSIYFFFKPIKVEQQDFIDIPLFEMKQFTLYELNNRGLTTLMSGTSSIRYSDRYKVLNINFTNNSKEYIANMTAGSGVYNEDRLELKDNIVFSREDGLTFQTDSAIYNKKTDVIKTQGKYRASIGKNIVTADSLIYFNLKKEIESKNIVIVYQLGE